MGRCTGSFTNLFLLLLLVEKERGGYFGRLLAKKSTDASQRVIGRHVEEIYIYRPFCRSWLPTSHRINVSLRLSSPSPALQPSPPSIFSDPCGSTRSGTRDGYPSGHQTWTPSADSSRTCVCSTVNRCAWNKRMEWKSSCLSFFKLSHLQT